MAEDWWYGLFVCFRMVRMDGGQWTPASRQGYNLRDAIARYTLQVLYCLFKPEAKKQKLL
jgi:hypothetical protein